MRYLGPLRRSTFVCSWLIQALFIYICAGLEFANVVPNDAGDVLPDSFIVLLPLALLSFQSAGQMVISRVLGYAEVTSVVLTSAYFDLGFDEKLMAGPTKNVKRNRRVASMIMVLVGAIAGGFLTQDEDISKVLWLAGSLKVAIALVWVFWKSKGSVRLE
jgi:hypothetical protein